MGIDFEAEVLVIRRRAETLLNTKHWETERRRPHQWLGCALLLCLKVAGPFGILSLALSVATLVDGLAQKAEGFSPGC